MAKGGKKRSRVSPKEAEKEVAKGASGVRRDREWVTSTVTQRNLEQMVIDGILQDQVTAGWRAAAGELFPTPDTNELIVFESHFVRGFGIPAHPFLQKLLDFYGITLCNLHPNSILHISLFINLCEAFIGITPHFNLFRYLFVLKSFIGSGSPKVVGGVFFQLRDEMVSEYIRVPLNTSLNGWNARWFYICNAEPSLSDEIDFLAVPRPNWSARPISSDMTQVKELLQILGQLRQNLDGVGVAINFIMRRIQPSKERACPAFEYAGDDDPVREAPEKMERNDAYARLVEFFVKNTKIRNVGQQSPYSITNPPPELRKYQL